MESDVDRVPGAWKSHGKCFFLFVCFLFVFCFVLFVCLFFFWFCFLFVCLVIFFRPGIVMEIVKK